MILQMAKILIKLESYQGLTLQGYSRIFFQKLFAAEISAENGILKIFGQKSMRGNGTLVQKSSANSVQKFFHGIQLTILKYVSLFRYQYMDVTNIQLEANMATWESSHNILATFFFTFRVDSNFLKL